MLDRITKVIDNSMPLLIFIIMAAFMVGVVRSGVRDSPYDESTYSHYPPPVIEWTRTDSVRCHAWPLDSGMWFYRCTNNTYGTDTHGNLFRTLSSTP